MAEYKLSYTASEIDKRLGKVSTNENDIKNIEKAFESSGGDTISIPNYLSGTKTIYGSYIKISDTPISMAELQNGGSYVITYIDKGTESNMSFKNTGVQNYLGNANMLQFGAFISVIADITLSGETVSAGLYADAFSYISNTYASSLTINGYSGFATTKLKESYLPESSLVVVQNNTPSKGAIWIDTDASEEILIAEIDDDTIDPEKTWSSKKIDEEVSELNENLVQKADKEYVDSVVEELRQLIQNGDVENDDSPIVLDMDFVQNTVQHYIDNGVVTVGDSTISELMYNEDGLVCNDTDLRYGLKLTKPIDVSGSWYVEITAKIKPYDESGTTIASDSYANWAILSGVDSETDGHTHSNACLSPCITDVNGKANIRLLASSTTSREVGSFFLHDGLEHTYRIEKDSNEIIKLYRDGAKFRETDFLEGSSGYFEYVFGIHKGYKYEYMYSTEKGITIKNIKVERTDQTQDAVLLVDDNSALIDDDGNAINTENKTKSSIGYKKIVDLEQKEQIVTSDLLLVGNEETGELKNIKWQDILECISIECLKNEEEYKYEYTRIDGEYVDNNNGSFISNASYYRTGYIDLTNIRLFRTTSDTISQYNCFYDADKNYISSFKITKTVIVPKNAKYMCLSASTKHPFDLYVMNFKSIDDYNSDKEIINIQASYGRNKHANDPYSVLRFLHFTDIHGDQLAWNRIIEYANKHKDDYIDFLLHTGDYTPTYQSDYVPLYENGLKPELPFYNVIGNHDVHTSNENMADKETTHEMFFENVSDLDVTFMQGDYSMTYYKDFVSSNVRLVVIDNYYDLETQATWLADVLSDAKSKGYHVITAMHQLSHRIAQKLDTGFQTKFPFEDYGGNHSTTIFDAVLSEFINDGGVHVCNLVGHEHSDMIGYTSNGVLNISVEGASANPQWCDGNRVIMTKTFDSFNNVFVNANIGCFTLVRIGNNVDSYGRQRNVLTYDYVNKEIVVTY